MYGSDGKKWVNKFRVYQYYFGTERDPTVAVFNDDEFIIAWVSDG